MSIEVRIPKEIKEYKEKIIFGLSFRQLISVFVAGVVCFGTYFLTKPFLGSNIASDIIIIEAMPIFAFGFIKVKGLNFEEYALIFIKHKLGNNKRIYENKLNLEYIEKEESKEVKKVEFNKFRVEAEEQRTIGRTAKIKEIRRRIKIAKKEFKAETKRRQTKEIDESKEQIKVARENYKRARKSKNK